MRKTDAPVRIGIIGVGAVSDQHHVPGIRLDPRTELTAICDADTALLERRRSEWNVERAFASDQELIERGDVDAVIVATPNFLHREQCLRAIEAGKHVMCEKPLGLNADEVAAMYQAAKTAGVVHMTAFTYRFAPSMKYLSHLLRTGALGEPRHFRSQRFLDWPETSWGWRQYRKTAGAGDLFDMTIHRIDFAIDLLGPLERIRGALARFAARDRTADGQSCAPSDVDDWSCLIGRFRSGATGVWEGTTLAKGYHQDGFGHEWAEINGSEGTAVYRLREPNTILIGRPGEDLELESVPQEFLKPLDSPRSVTEGDPARIFRYDLVWEFVSAILEGRGAIPSFREGLNAQVVADAAIRSDEAGSWESVPFIEA